MSCASIVQLFAPFAAIFSFFSAWTGVFSVQGCPMRAAKEPVQPQSHRLIVTATVCALQYSSFRKMATFRADINGFSISHKNSSEVSVLCPYFARAWATFLLAWSQTHSLFVSAAPPREESYVNAQQYHMMEGAELVAGRHLSHLAASHPYGMVEKHGATSDKPHGATAPIIQITFFQGIKSIFE